MSKPTATASYLRAALALSTVPLWVTTAMAWALVHLLHSAYLRRTAPLHRRLTRIRPALTLHLPEWVQIAWSPTVPVRSRRTALMQDGLWILASVLIAGFLVRTPILAAPYPAPLLAPLAAGAGFALALPAIQSRCHRALTAWVVGPLITAHRITPFGGDALAAAADPTDGSSPYPVRHYAEQLVLATWTTDPAALYSNPTLHLDRVMRRCRDAITQNSSNAEERLVKTPDGPKPWFTVLGVRDDAPLSEVRDRYRSAMRRLQPVLLPLSSATSAEREAANEHMLSFNEAWRIAQAVTR